MLLSQILRLEKRSIKIPFAASLVGDSSTGRFIPLPGFLGTKSGIVDQIESSSFGFKT